MAKTRDKDLRRFVHASTAPTFPPSPTGTACWRPSRPRSAATCPRWPGSCGSRAADRGGKGRIALLPDAHKLAALLPDGTLEVIPGVGHLIHYETPEPAAGFIRRFLKDQPA